jgi:hypothetical protein
VQAGLHASGPADYDNRAVTIDHMVKEGAAVAAAPGKSTLNFATFSIILHRINTRWLCADAPHRPFAISKRIPAAGTAPWRRLPTQNDHEKTRNANHLRTKREQVV